MNTKIASVYRTTNYDRFRRLEGNREVTAKRAKNIAKSISEIGYILNPIIVNEKMEIVDGQGRFEALKSISHPIDYVVVDGAGLNECVAMNNSTSRWTLMDYIYSHAEKRGKNQESYIYLRELMKAYKSKMPMEPIIYASDRKHRSSNVFVSHGLYECDEKGYEDAVKILDQLARIYPLLKEVKGHRERYATAICFMLRHPQVDGDRLYEQILKQKEKMRGVTSQGDALSVLEDTYNYRTKNKVYLQSEFKKEREGK